MTRYLRWHLNDLPIHVVGDASAKTRDFVHVSDLVAGLVLIADRGTSGEVYNVGSGTEISMRQLCEVIGSVTGSPARIDEITEITEDTYRLVADITKLRGLGYVPQMPIENGVRQVAELLGDAPDLPRGETIFARGQHAEHSLAANTAESSTGRTGGLILPGPTGVTVTGPPERVMRLCLAAGCLGPSRRGNRTTMADPYDLQRFVDAQDRGGTYDSAVEELRRGRKTTHWMWFVFPQIAGLGRSEMARRYAITSLEEAKAYLEHPVLGPRLLECARILAGGDHGSAEQVMGSVDAQKLRSSMTLFLAAAPGAAVPAGSRPVLRGATDPGTVPPLRVRTRFFAPRVLPPKRNSA